MNAAIKKITCVVFILLGLVPLLLTFVVTIQKEKIWERMKEKMEGHELQTVVLSEKDVVWMDDHEIWVNEHMFDIRTKKLENGVYTFTGMYDEEETYLVKKQQDRTGDQQEDNKLLVRLFKCLNGFYCEPGDEMGSESIACFQYNTNANSAVPDYTPAIPTPPPQA